MSREEIEREAAAQLGLRPDESQTAGSAEPAHTADHAAEAADPAEAGSERSPAGSAEEPHGHPDAGHGESGLGRVVARLRGRLQSEPASVRRERLEREAAAALGLHDQPEQPVG